MTFPILIHIGYPKTGSSTLQQNVLMKHSGVNYLAGTKFAERLGQGSSDAQRAHDFYHALIHDSTRDMAALRATWTEVFAPKMDKKRLNVISDERFVMNYRAPEAIAADLSELIGDARILMVVRDQADMLRSQYDMSPFYERDPARKYLPFGRWLDEMLSNASDNMARCMKYGDVVDIYARLFGNNALVVLPFSGLFSDTEVQAAFSAAFGLDVEETRTLFLLRPTGDYKAHGYKKYTRRVLGRRPPSDFLSPRQLRIAKWVLRRLFPAQKTEINPDQTAYIRQHFAGHAPSDVLAVRKPDHRY